MLGHITKRGNGSLRTLLIHGARTVLQYTAKRTDAKSRWVETLRQRRGDNIATVAFIFPFDQAPQVYHSRNHPPEGTPGHFYRLRLADLNLLAVGVMRFDFTYSEGQVVRSPVAAAVFDHQHWMF